MAYETLKTHLEPVAKLFETMLDDNQKLKERNSYLGLRVGTLKRQLRGSGSRGYSSKQVSKVCCKRCQRGLKAKKKAMEKKKAMKALETAKQRKQKKKKAMRAEAEVRLFKKKQKASSSSNIYSIQDAN